MFPFSFLFKKKKNVFYVPDQVITLTKALFVLPLAQEISLCWIGCSIVQWV